MVIFARYLLLYSIVRGPLKASMHVRSFPILGTLIIGNERELGCIAVFEWALFGIALKQAAIPSIAATAWIVMVVLAVMAVLVLVEARPRAREKRA
ncbi:MAG: hypothetical protein Q6373_005430 [Candidatus Sigynarchaeota archaeon]